MKLIEAILKLFEQPNLKLITKYNKQENMKGFECPRGLGGALNTKSFAGNQFPINSKKKITCCPNRSTLRGRLLENSNRRNTIFSVF